MDSQGLMKLQSEIKAGFNLERIEKVQSILNDIIEEAIQKQFISADVNITIDVVLNYIQTQVKSVNLEQGTEQSSSLNQEQLDELSNIILSRCVWTPLGIKCS